jgi:peptidoglycan/xylan/chitin deacetylase (PgdA/CDA1 family)
MRAILTYHSVDSSGSVISIDPVVFQRQLTWLARSRVRVVPLEQLTEIGENDDAVALTFDDAFRNFRTAASDLIAELGFPCTLFVPSARAGATNQWDSAADPAVPVLPLLDWDELGTLAERGVTIGAHSRTHPRLDTVPVEQLIDEIVGAADDIEAHIGRRPDVFAYPYGSSNEHVAGITRANYAMACTTELRPLRGGEDRALLPRVDMFYLRHPGQLEAWGTARFRFRLTVRSRARAARGRLARLTGRA